MQIKKDPTILANNLRYLLRKHGLSQKEIAKNANIPITSFTQYYNGISYPGSKNLNKIADYFKLKIEELTVTDLTTNEANLSNKNDLIKILKNHKKDLTKEQLKTLEQIIILLLKGEEVLISWSKKI